MRGRGIYDNQFIDVFAQVVDAGRAAPEVREVQLAGLEVGATLADDVLTLNGSLLAARGQPVSNELRDRLLNVGPHVVRQPLRVVAALPGGSRK